MVKPSVLSCPRCSLVNAVDNMYCSKCSYPLVPSAFDEIKAAENIDNEMHLEIIAPILETIANPGATSTKIIYRSFTSYTAARISTIYVRKEPDRD